MLRECPCKDCKKRHINCHGECQDYKDWSEENESFRNKRHKTIDNFYLSRTDRPKRRNGKK